MEGQRQKSDFSLYIYEHGSLSNCYFVWYVFIPIPREACLTSFIKVLVFILYYLEKIVPKIPKSYPLFDMK